MLMIAMGARRRTSSGAFGAVFNATLASNGSGYSSATWRYVFSIAGLTVPSGTPTQARVGFKAHTTTDGCTITSAYIGHKASTGDTYDFDASPIQLLFGGLVSVTIASGSSLVSDNANFAWNKSSDILIAFYVNDAMHDNLAFNASVANIEGFSKIGNDASAVDATGYTSGGARLDGIYLIETNGF